VHRQHRLGQPWADAGDGLEDVEDAALVDTVTALATRLAGMPTQALVATRQALSAAQDMNLAGALANEAQLQSRFGAAHDYLEGVDAFRNKRAPRFTDR